MENTYGMLEEMRNEYVILVRKLSPIWEMAKNRRKIMCGVD